MAASPRARSVQVDGQEAAFEYEAATAVNRVSVAERPVATARGYQYLDTVLSRLLDP